MDIILPMIAGLTDHLVPRDPDTGLAARVDLGVADRDTPGFAIHVAGIVEILPVVFDCACGAGPWPREIRPQNADARGFVAVERPGAGG